MGKPKGAVLVVHDSRGLTAHFSDVVGRFAGAGYAALCVDLLSAQGGTAPDPSRVPMALSSLPPSTLIGSLRAGIVELGRRVPGAKIGAVGFGFGGGALWQLLGAGDPILAAAVPLYGVIPENVSFSKTHAAVLALYPADDHTLSESQDNADMAMLDANLVHSSTLYAGATSGFFDDTGSHYNAGAASKAWKDTLDWLNRYLVTARPASPAIQSPSGAPGAHPSKAPKGTNAPGTP